MNSLAKNKLLNNKSSAVRLRLTSRRQFRKNLREARGSRTLDFEMVEEKQEDISLPKCKIDWLARR